MRLRRSDPAKPGITRRRVGKGFSYWRDGRRVTDAQTLDRIKALVLPPAWADVWICADGQGHLQATGTDAAGRRQYRYHDQWRSKRDAEKFEHMLGFARALPKLRKRIEADLGAAGLGFERVAAAAVRLLDTAALRIGGESYAQDDPVLGDATFGLATLRRDHVTVQKGALCFCFPGKGGAEFEFAVTDSQLAGVVKKLKHHLVPGEELFAFKREGDWQDLKSSHINEYLRDAAGLETTAKDFRTWNGTVAVSLALAPAATSQRQRRAALAQAMRDAAELLGNTPAVAKKSYVDSRITDHYESGVTVRIKKAPDVGAVFADRKHWHDAERAVLKLIG
jgi:DNA topoisomerase-1